LHWKKKDLSQEYKPRIDSVAKKLKKPDANSSSHGSGSVIHIESDNDFTSILQKAKTNKKIIIADMFADWCGPCRQMAPIFEELASKYPSIMFIKVNADQTPATSQTYRIKGLPSFLVFKDGNEIDRMTGANPQGLQELAAKYK